MRPEDTEFVQDELVCVVDLCDEERGVGVVDVAAVGGWGAVGGLRGAGGGGERLGGEGGDGAEIELCGRKAVSV